MGRIGKEPELIETNSGTQLCKTSLATSEKYKGNDQTEWHTIVSFGKTAELISQYVHKGDFLCVVGKITTRKWEDNNGNNRYSTEIIVSEIKFVPSGKNKNQDQQQQQRQAPKTYKQASIPDEELSDFSSEIDDEEYPF